MPRDQILLLADDLGGRQSIAEALKSQGYGVTQAADAQEACARLQAQDFSLALLDLQPAGLPGPELWSRVKAQCPDCEVVFIAGEAELEGAIAALGLGAHGCLRKSALNVAELQAVVAQALERRRLARSNRELQAHLSQARDELGQRRTLELQQIRRVGEVLAGSLTWDQLLEGLAGLIWESLPLAALALEFQGTGADTPLVTWCRRPGLSDPDFAAFQDWFRHHSGSPPPQAPWPALLHETVRAGEAQARLAAAREAPFSPEERELFRIFTLQTEATLKNLLLFEQVKSLAIRDGLTGLYNYRYFAEILRYEVAKCRRYHTPLSLVFMDIDDFKHINDSRGHLAGDKVLQKVGALLQQAVRHADLLCRYGGDEFVLLLTQTPPAHALMLAERLRRLISQTSISTVDADFRVTVSIGVAGLEAGMTWEDLVKAADGAHYRAKEAGKNRVHGPEIPEE